MLHVTLKRGGQGTLLVVQWLRLRASKQEDAGLIIGRGAKIHMLHGVAKNKQSFPDGSVVKNLRASVGDTGSIPDLGRSHMTQSN